MTSWSLIYIGGEGARVRSTNSLSFGLIRRQIEGGWGKGDIREGRVVGMKEGVNPLELFFVEERESDFHYSTSVICTNFRGDTQDTDLPSTLRSTRTRTATYGWRWSK